MLTNNPFANVVKKHVGHNIFSPNGNIPRLFSDSQLCVSFKVFIACLHAATDATNAISHAMDATNVISHAMYAAKVILHAI